MSTELNPEALEAAIEAAWPGEEVVYADEHDGPESMIGAAIRAYFSHRLASLPAEVRECVERLESKVCASSAADCLGVRCACDLCGDAARLLREYALVKEGEWHK